MQRRIALAISLALTVITTFSIVVVGAKTGLFGGNDSAGAEQEFALVTPAVTVPLDAPPAAQQEAPAASDPVYVTEYVYVDAPARAAQPRASAAASNGAPANATAEPTQPPAAGPTTAGASPTTAPAAPTTVPTSAPAVPTTPSQPTVPPASAPGPSELEFAGIVTAMNGSMVTFRHGGADTIVKVTINLNQLGIGSSVKVHAIWVSSGYYVAKEIEFGEGG